MEILRCEALSKVYRSGESKVIALDQVSLSLAQGSFTAITGPSGSGKSTLLRAINRLIPISGGTVWLDGQAVSALRGKSLRQLRRKVGMIFQNYNLVYSLYLRADTLRLERRVRNIDRRVAVQLDALRAGLKAQGITENAVNLVQDTSRSSAAALMTANGYVDLLIPRGGAGLINACVRSATVPCIATGTGICHIYVDKEADLAMAANIIENAKASRPSVCNAAEVCLVHRDIAGDFLPLLYKTLVIDRLAEGLTPVELRLDAAAAMIIPGKAAGPDDFDTEFLDYTLAVAVVDSLDAAADWVKQNAGEGDLVITLGCGDIYKAARKMVQEG